MHREPSHRADALAEEEAVTDLMGEGGGVGASGGGDGEGDGATVRGLEGSGD